MPCNYFLYISVCYTCDGWKLIMIPQSCVLILTGYHWLIVTIECNTKWLHMTIPAEALCSWQIFHTGWYVSVITHYPLRSRGKHIWFSQCRTYTIRRDYGMWPQYDFTGYGRLERSIFYLYVIYRKYTGTNRFHV